MSQENVDVLRRFVEAFNSHSFELMSELVTDDFEFVPYLAGTLANASYHGQEAMRKYFADADAAWEEIRLWSDEVRDVNEGLLVYGGIRARGRVSNLQTEVALTWWVELREGRLRRVRSFANVDEALEAAGLSE